MFVSRPRPHTLAALVRSSQASFNTSSSSCSTSPDPKPKPSEDSIFSAAESPWDHVFSDIPDVNAPSPYLPAASQRQSSRLPALDRVFSGSAKSRGGKHATSLMQRSSVVHKQRAAITAREMSVFDEMFDLIFNAVNEQDGKHTLSSSSSSSSASPPPRSRVSSSSSTSFTGQAPSIGRGSENSPLNDLFRTLRRHTSRVRWTTEIDEELDRKKETMELFNTDQELLQWAMKELFGESQQWDEEAKKAIAAAKDGGKDKGKTTTTEASSSSSPTTPSASSATPVGPTLNPSIYPHLIAHVMRIFRTTYTNPTLSLAIFNHAARVSIPSYVFGCTAPAYNELMEAKWEGWGDLEGVCNALEEMRANGVVSDGRTRIVVEKVRREVGEARPAELGGRLFGDEIASETTSDAASPTEAEKKQELNPLASKAWKDLGEAEVMRLLHRIEQLALRGRPRKASPYEELWKTAALKPNEDDGWSFDKWEQDEGATKQKRKEKPRQKQQSSLLRWPDKKKTALPPRDWSNIKDEDLAFR